eukprot:SAG11_NODE_114_length_16040_cov_10.050875_16_plen_130_part_00
MLRRRPPRASRTTASPLPQPSQSSLGWAVQRCQEAVRRLNGRESLGHFVDLLASLVSTPPCAIMATTAGGSTGGVRVTHRALRTGAKSEFMRAVRAFAMHCAQPLTFSKPLERAALQANVRTHAVCHAS